MRRRQGPPPPRQGPPPQPPVRVPPHRRRSERKPFRPLPPPTEAAQKSDPEEIGLDQGDEKHLLRCVTAARRPKPGGGGRFAEGSESHHSADGSIAAIAHRVAESGRETGVGA